MPERVREVHRVLGQALPLSVRNCRCGLPLDFSGHHRAACARAVMLGRRGYALESVAARICREAGGRVRTNMFVRDMDLDVPVSDGRRLEVVVDGLPLHGGAQHLLEPTCQGVVQNKLGDCGGEPCWRVWQPRQWLPRC